MVMHEAFDVGKRKESSFSRSRRQRYSESECAYGWLLFVICECIPGSKINSSLVITIAF